MISKLLLALEKGITVMRSNSRMLLVAILVFVFPLLFTWLTHSFLATATTNIETVDGKRLGAIHKAVSTVISYNETQSDFINNLLRDLVADNKQDLVTLRVLVEGEDGFEVLYADDTSVIGAKQPINQHVMNAGFTEERDFNRFAFTFQGQRIWHGYTKVSTLKRDYYIFSEQNFTVIDGIMSNRQMQAYYGLTAIFVFLIALAYWLNMQVDWHRKYLTLSAQLKERDLFSNMIAHEFRAPLTAIKGYASFLQDAKEISDEEKRYVSIIRSQAERLVLLVNDFLEVARLQSGKMKLQNETIDIREIIIAVTEDLKITAKEKGLELKYNPGAAKIFIETDKNRLTQALINIINNAIKYTEKGQIEVSCTQKNDEIKIRVMDTGAGISAEDQKKLFAPFERVGGAEDSEKTGTGLGMYITKKLVVLLEGSISVESIEGVGSHVVLNFKAKSLR